MASQQSDTEVLREFPGGWMQCRDPQGVFYYNSITRQSADQPPPELLNGGAANGGTYAAPATATPYATSYSGQPSAYAPQLGQLSAQQVAAQQPTPQTNSLGDWQICEDAQGEFYMHKPTGRTYDQPPQALLDLVAASKAQQQAPAQYAAPAQYSAPPQQAAAQYAPQQQYGQQQQQQQQQYTQPQAGQTQAATVKATIGVWQICEDAEGEFYANTTTGQTFDQAPQELIELVRARKAQSAGTQQATYAAAPQQPAGPMAYKYQGGPAAYSQGGPAAYKYQGADPVPAAAYEKYQKAQAAFNQYTYAGGQYPSAAQAAASKGVPPQQLNNALQSQLMRLQQHQQQLQQPQSYSYDQYR